MVTSSDGDESLLARIGYKQELRREFSKWSTISYAISILGVLGSVPATFGAPLSAGGPATAVWCWLLGSCMAMCIGSSVAELVSAYPTAGGMYFVTKHVVPEDQVPIFSWIQGWCNLLGQTAGVSSVAYTISQMLLAGASMQSDFVDGQYSYTPYVKFVSVVWDATNRDPRSALQTVVLSIVILCILGVVSSLTTKSLHRIILWFAPINGTLPADSLCIQTADFIGQCLQRLASALSFSTLLQTNNLPAGFSLISPTARDGAPKGFLFCSGSCLLHGR